MTRLPACPNCASPLRTGLRFCTRCGAALHGQATVVDSPSTTTDPASAFRPVPALGPHSPAPAARLSILDLVASAEDAAVAESPAAEPVATIVSAPVAVIAPPSVAEPSIAAPPVVHPLGVPVISAQRPTGPGADPTHIGRSRSGASPPASTATPSVPSSTTVPPEQLPRHAPPAGRSGPRRYSPPPARSAAATWAFATGLLPLPISVAGNLLTTRLGLDAVAATESGVTTGAWAPVFVALALVFVANAALLTVCAIMGGRGIRETGNGVTKGRGLAVVGLSAGAVNLALWVAGLVITLSGFSTALV